MKKEPLVTIWILNYNWEKYLEKILDSIKEIVYSNLEILILDNNSIDRSKEILKKYSNKAKIIYSDKNLWYSKWKNLIVKNAKWDYVLLIDNDILINDKKLIDNLLDFYVSKKNIGFLWVSMTENVKDRIEYYGVYYSYFWIKYYKKGFYIDKTNIRSNTIKAWGYNWWIVFFKKEIWKKLWWYDISFPFHVDDIDLSARAWIMWYENYIYITDKVQHLGYDKYLDKLSHAKKWEYYYVWVMTTIWKNFRLKNAILTSLWFFIKYNAYLLILVLKNKSLYYIPYFFKGYIHFLKNISLLRQKRKKIQKNREIKKDIFLDIKLPKF